MKTVRFILLVSLILSLGFSTASAKNAPASYSYIPLVQNETYIPAKSFEAQAIDSYTRLLPQLLDARSQGQILDYHFIPNMGLLVVKNAPGTFNALAANTYTDAQAALAVIPTTKTRSASPSPAAVAPSYLLPLHSSCFEAYNQGAGKRVGIKWTDKNGKILGVWEGIADSNGYLSGCNYSGSVTYLNEPDNKIVIKRYAGSLQLSNYQTTFPLVNFYSFTLTAASGNGAAGKKITITRYHSKLDAANSTLTQKVSTTVGSNGKWSVTFPLPRLFSGNYFIATTSPDTRFTYTRVQQAPYAEVGLGTNIVDYYGFPSKEVSIDLRHGANTLNAKPVTDDWGWAEALFYKDGAPISIAKNDKLSATNLLDYILPEFTFELEPSTDTIVGVTQPYTWFYLSLKVGDTYYTKWIRSNSSGGFIADFSGDYDIRTSTFATVYLGLTDPRSRTYVWARVFTAP